MSRRAWLLPALLLAPLPLRAEHGSPGYRLHPEPDAHIPTNARIVLTGHNGVPFGLDTLRAMQPRLVAPDQPPIPLTIQRTYDDMEGRDDSPKARFAAGVGYGESVIVWRPKRTLKPDTAYTLMARSAERGEDGSIVWGEHEPFDALWTTGAGPDHEPPIWRAAPALLPRHPGAPPDGEEEGWGPAITLPIAPEPHGALLHIVAEVGDKTLDMWTYLDAALWIEQEASWRCARLDHHARGLAGKPVKLHIRVEDLAGNSTRAHKLRMRWPADAPGLSFCIPAPV
jgi:hypothetical protein